MPVPKTPKSSNSTVRMPKTPKHSAKGRGIAKQPKRARTDVIDGEVQKIKKKKKKVVPIETPDKSTQKNSNESEAKQSKKVPSPQKQPREKAPALPTDIDNVQTKDLLAQHTRAREVGKISLRVINEQSDDGLVDVSCITTAVRDALYDRSKLSEEQTAAIIAHITTAVPLSKMRFSKKAIHFTQYLAQKIFEDKLRDIHNMSLISKKQTITTEMVWAERNYRAKMNVSSAVRMKPILPSITQSMVEDAMVVHSNNPSRAQWDAFESVHERLNTGNTVSDLKNVAVATCGDGVWNN